MATVISKEELDAHARDMINRAWAGEEIVVEQSGSPKLRLVPVDESPKAHHRLGGTLRLGPLSDDEAEESIRPLPKEYWGDIGEDDR